MNGHKDEALKALKTVIDALPLPEIVYNRSRWKRLTIEDVDITFFNPRNPDADRAADVDQVHGEAEAAAPGP